MMKIFRSILRLLKLQMSTGWRAVRGSNAGSSGGAPDQSPRQGSSGGSREGTPPANLSRFGPPSSSGGPPLMPQASGTAVELPNWVPGPPARTREQMQLSAETAGSTTDTAPKKRRGINIGRNVNETVNRTRRNIRLEWDPIAAGPLGRKAYSMASRYIGSGVRDHVPMLASTFKKLEPADRERLLNHFTVLRVKC